MDDLFGRTPTSEQWRTIGAIEELGAIGLGELADEVLASYLADKLQIDRAEAEQRLAWFDEWMREPEEIHLPGDD